MDTISSYNRKYSLAGYILLLVLLLPPLALLIYSGYGSAASLVTDVSFLRQTGLALGNAALCTLAALILALPGMVIYAKCRPFFRKLLRVLLAFGFCFPPLVMGMGFDCLFGKGGFITELRLDPSIRSLIICLMLNIPLFIVMVGEHWRLLGLKDKQCALSLGSSRMRIFLSNTLPKIMPALAGTAALVFLRNMAGIGNEIIAMLLALPVLAVLVVSDRKRSRIELSSGPAKARFRMDNAFTVSLSSIYMICAVTLLLGPAVALFLRSVLTENGISFSVYATLFSALNLDWLVGLAFCVAAALAATIISSFISLHICVGIASSDSSIFPVMLPLAIGPAALALGFKVFYLWIPETVVVKMILTVLCNILIFIPIQTMVMLPALRRIPMTLRGTSLSLGFSGGYSFRHIDLRLMAVYIRSGVYTTTAMGLCSFGAAESLGLNTIFAQALRFYGKGDVRTAGAMGTVILILGFILFTAGVGHTREVKRYV